MPRLGFFLVAESIAVDRSTNRLSIFNVLEQITVVQLPTLFPAAAAVAWFHIDPTEMGRECQARLRVRGEAWGHQDQQEALTINFTCRAPRQRTMHLLQAFPIAAEGTLVFELLLDGDLVASHSVVVRAAPTEGQAAPADAPAG